MNIDYLDMFGGFYLSEIIYHTADTLPSLTDRIQITQHRTLRLKKMNINYRLSVFKFPVSGRTNFKTTAKTAGNRIYFGERKLGIKLLTDLGLNKSGENKNILISLATFRQE